MTLETEFVRFEVLDGGPGLVPGVDPFRKFERGGAAGEGGLGLGLALVRAAAEAHGGRAFLRAGSEGGAVAGFELAR